MNQIMQIFIKRLGETLYVGDDVQVTIFAIKGDEVRLGIEAPKSVPIRREQLTIKKHRANPHRPRWRATPTRSLCDFSSSRFSSITVPGVTIRTTSRLTVGPVDSFASSTCSQIATLLPARMSRARYVSRAW